MHGSATIQAVPDQAQLQASISVNADTADLAIKKLSGLVNRIIAVLTSNGLTADNYATSSFSLYPNTSYSNGETKVVGQIATQSFQITIPTISKDGSNIGKLVDSLATVNGIVLNGLSFDVANKTCVYQQARQQAFQNAQNKAQDYAIALQIGVSGVLSVVDSFSSPAVVTQSDAPILSFSANKAIVPTTINVGTISISYDLDIIFSFIWNMMFPLYFFKPTLSISTCPALTPTHHKC